MNDYTLGLDIGSNSIGWALLQTKGKPLVVAIGVRAFPEGVDRDTQGLEKSKNATRREARGARRQRYRRILRRNQILKTLQRTGLLPKGEKEQQDLFKKEPYKLRAKGLDTKLELYEFGRALFHLNQRRGFKSNRKSGKAKEDGTVIKEANELQKEIDNDKCRTLGEYFDSINPEEQRIRERYTFRSMYEKEFDLLWEKQAQFYPEILTEKLRDRIRNEIIFFQRPLKPSDELIGDCELERGEKRCPRGDWYARKFRILQDVNNLKIQNPDGTEENLTPQQRQTILESLNQKEKLEFDKIREKLNLMETQLFNLEQDGKAKTLKGDVFAAVMKSKNIFGPKVWDNIPVEEKIALNTACIEIEDDELAKFLREKYNFDNEKIDRVFKIPLPDKYMSFSLKAIKKLLPTMEQGKRTDEALDEIYPNRNKNVESENKNRLDLPEDLRNPIVNKALFEVRKVVNSLIREYGKPAKIAIEMARDVQGSKQQREELHWKILDNEKRNKEVRDKLIEMGITRPSRDDVIKYKLWEECGRRCPYIGKTISQHQLFGEHPEFQVEHILPYDRSLDDSFMNKTLCEVHENIHVKKNQTPFEAYNHTPEKYEEIKQNIKVLPWPKRQKFLQKEINLDTHISRELNDTRYICKEVIKYLKQLGVYVRGTRGKITSELRHQWGLDGIFDELGVRRDDDHRRHAVDAVVVGVTENEHLRKLARSKYSVTGEPFVPPWPDFRQEVKENVRHINVSHRVQRKVSGQLHEETNYGLTGRKDEKGQDIYVYRKRLEDLTIPMVSQIVDPVAREIVRNRLIEKGIDPSKNQKIPKEVWNEPLYMKNKKSSKRVQIKKVRIHDVKNNAIVFNDENGNPYRAVEPGSNHHIEIFEYKDKKGNVKREGRVITMFDAVQRSQKGEPVVQRNSGDSKRFVCSLAINEMFMLELDNGNSELHRVQKISSNGQIFFRPHIYSGDLKKQPAISKVPNQLKGHKVTVDPIGRVWPAND